MKKYILCFMLVFAVALMTACTSTDNKAGESTMAPTNASTAGPVSGPTEDSAGMESTGVIDGLGEDIKKGAEDVKDGVEDTLDMTSASGESTAAQ